MNRDEVSGPYRGGNDVLDTLSAEVKEELHPHLIVLEQEEATVRISRNEPIDALYFPIDAIYSVIVELSNGSAYEVDLIGRNGVVYGEVALGAEVAARTVMCQQAGRVARLALQTAISMSVAYHEFREAVQASIRRQWFVSQQTVACNYAHNAQQRAARWILMTQDAVGRPNFGLRPEFASMMLGISPSAVLAPLLALADFGCILYEAEHVTVIARDALRSKVCECYERQMIAFMPTARIDR